LGDDLTAQRTAALRAVVAGYVPVALATLAHALALPVFYFGHAENPLDVRVVLRCVAKALTTIAAPRRHAARPFAAFVKQ
jgi:hypothetical protein